MLLRTNSYLIEYVFADVRIDRAERVVKEVVVSIIVNRPSERDTLLLTARQINSCEIKKVFWVYFI